MGSDKQIPMASRRWPGVDPARSRVMSLVRGKNTSIEITVRSLIHRLGYRYALHRKDLPGTPDIVFPSRRKAIFVHGCYWHGHSDPQCRRARLPKTRTEFWTDKIKRNAERDRATERSLRDAGWGIMVIWECETPVSHKDVLTKRVIKFLEDADLTPVKKRLAHAKQEGCTCAGGPVGNVRRRAIRD